MRTFTEIQDSILQQAEKEGMESFEKVGNILCATSEEMIMLKWNALYADKIKQFYQNLIALESYLIQYKPSSNDPMQQKRHQLLLDALNQL